MIYARGPERGKKMGCTLLVRGCKTRLWTLEANCFIAHFHSITVADSSGILTMGDSGLEVSRSLQVKPF